MKVLKHRKGLFLTVLVTAIIIGCAIVYVLNRPVRDVIPVICSDELHDLHLALLSYTMDYKGVLPPAGWNEAHNQPQWISSLEDWARQSVHDDGEKWIHYALKCPLDSSSEPFSYNLNPDLAGKNIESIPEKMWGLVPLALERPHRHSHGNILYLDGNVKRVDEGTTPEYY
jgi:prepilin-type processing-associated H-X9-DG protein